MNINQNQANYHRPTEQIQSVSRANYSQTAGSLSGLFQALGGGRSDLSGPITTLASRLLQQLNAGNRDSSPSARREAPLTPHNLPQPNSQFAADGFPQNPRYPAQPSGQPGTPPPFVADGSRQNPGVQLPIPPFAADGSPRNPSKPSPGQPDSLPPFAADGSPRNPTTPNQPNGYPPPSIADGMNGPKPPPPVADGSGRPIPGPLDCENGMNGENPPQIADGMSSQPPQKPLSESPFAADGFPRQLVDNDAPTKTKWGK